MKKVKLTQEDYLQALDYSYVLLESYNNTMDKCRVLGNKKIKKAYEKALVSMWDLYQLIGKESNEIK